MPAFVALKYGPLIWSVTDIEIPKSFPTLHKYRDLDVTGVFLVASELFPPLVLLMSDINPPLFCTPFETCPECLDCSEAML